MSSANWSTMQQTSAFFCLNQQLRFMKYTLVVLLAIVTVLSCSKNSPVAGNSSTISSSSLSDTAFVNDSTDFYDITVDEMRTVHVLGHKLISFTGSSGDFASNMIDYSFFSDTSSYADFEFHKGVLKKTVSDSTLLLFNKKQMINLLPGLYIYTKDPILENGIYLVLRDPNGVTWNTMLGSGDQSGSSFRIEKQLNLDSNFTATGISHSMHIICNFECTVYDGKGHQKKISNGRLGLSLWL